MAGATGRIQGRVLGSFPLVLPVGDVSISKGRKRLFFLHLGVFFTPSRVGGGGVQGGQE